MIKWLKKIIAKEPDKQFSARLVCMSCDKLFDVVLSPYYKNNPLPSNMFFCPQCKKSNDRESKP